MSPVKVLYLFWKLFFEIRIAAKVVKLSYAGMLVVVILPFPPYFYWQVIVSCLN